MSDTEDEDGDDDYEGLPLEKPALPEFDEHARAIGYICAHWAWLEKLLALFLEYYIPLDLKVSGAVTANIDFREKIQIALTVGYLHRKSDEWFSDLRELLNYIDNELRPLRNRLIHDEWDYYGDAVWRRQFKTRFIKRQSFAPEELETWNEFKTPVEDVWELASAIYESGHDLGGFVRDWVIFGDEWPPERSPQQSPHPNNADARPLKKSDEAE